MKATALRALALTSFGAAAAWSLGELLASGSVVGLAILSPVWFGAAVGAVAAPWRDRLARERGSRVALGFVFFANRIALLGPEVLALAGFLALLVGIAALQRFDRLFGPAYRAARGAGATVQAMDRALMLGLLRAGGAIGLSLVLTLVASNAIVAGFLPFTSSVTALVLALLFIGVIARLARLPAQAREESPPSQPGNV